MCYVFCEQLHWVFFRTLAQAQLALEGCISGMRDSSIRLLVSTECDVQRMYGVELFQFTG